MTFTNAMHRTGEIVRYASLIALFAFIGIMIATSDLTTYAKVKVFAAMVIFAGLAFMRFARRKAVVVRPQHDPFFEQVRQPKR